MWSISYQYFLSYFLGAQKNLLHEMVLLSTHNICFGWEIRKIILITHLYALVTFATALYLFVFGFWYNFSGIIGGYKLHVWCMRLYALQSPCIFFWGGGGGGGDWTGQFFQKLSEIYRNPSHCVIFTHSTQKRRMAVCPWATILRFFKICHSA